MADKKRPYGNCPNCFHEGNGLEVEGGPAEWPNECVPGCFHCRACGSDWEELIGNIPTHEERVEALLWAVIKRLGNQSQYLHDLRRAADPNNHR